MSTLDHTEIVVRALAQDVEELQQRMEFYEAMLAQVIEALASAGIIRFEEDEEESSIIEP
jgi:2-phospho-L-lactate guanylyltransferase (CobY/MobA/RfbA family)